MTNEPDSDRPDDPMAESENVLRDYDRIQKQLGEGFDGDPRLASGVPQDQRGSDIEFIQMSGLVRPTSPPAGAAPPAHDDLDSSRPVSFFEKGVADVDADMVPGVLEDRATANQEIRPIQQTQAAMSHLRDIIADLTKDSPTAAPDPELMAALDSPGKPSDALAELPPAPPDTAAAQGPVSLDDMLSEFAPTHPMLEETETPAATQQPAETAQEIRRAPAREETSHVATNAPSTPEAPPLVRPAPVLFGHNAQLVEAEKLLEELEPAPVSQFDATSTAASPVDRPTRVDIGLQAADVDELSDGVLDYKQQGQRRHRATGKNPVARGLLRTAAGLLIVSALAVATYAGYLWIQQRMVSPEQLFNQAARLAAKGDYAAASQMFDQFASLHPNDPMRAEAQFNAAFTMQLQKPADNDQVQEVIRQALRLFDQYRKENPTHQKLARAETIMGRLNYESGRYPEAIDLLRNPELRLRDPVSAVPALRTLARASAKMGDAEAARSYYLQAVGVQGNHSPDVDYAELGSLYQSRADRAEDLDKRIELQQLAIDSWTRALEVPSIDPSSKQTIRSQLDVLRERLQSEPGMAPAMESLNDAAAVEDDTAAAETGDAAPAADTQASLPDAGQTAEPAAPGNPADPAAQTQASSPETSAPEQHEAQEAGEHATPGESEYIVKQGDTLTSIAEAHHLSLDELKELNALSGDKVLDGQHLKVPAAKP
jgi:tetratricopeptide (TPR) repeat protein